MWVTLLQSQCYRLFKVYFKLAKKELQAFLGIINYLGKFSPRTVEVCELLRKLTSAKVEWTWNATYQKMFKEAKAIIKEDACMKL